MYKVKSWGETGLSEPEEILIAENKHDDSKKVRFNSHWNNKYSRGLFTLSSILSVGSFQIEERSFPQSDRMDHQDGI